jgi:hypothetical protein
MEFWERLGREVFGAAFFIVLALHLVGFIHDQIKQIFRKEKRKPE